MCPPLRNWSAGVLKQKAMTVYIVLREDRRGMDAIELIFSTLEGAENHCTLMNNMTHENDYPYTVLPHQVEPE